MKKNTFLLISTVPAIVALFGIVLSLTGAIHATYSPIWNMIQPFYPDGAFIPDRVLNALFTLLFASGIVRYARNPQSYKTILFCLVVLSIQSIWFSGELLILQLSESTTLPVLLLIVLLLKSSFYAWAGIRLSRELLKHEVPVSETRQLDHDIYEVFEETPLTSRAAGWVLDVIVFMLLFRLSVQLMAGSLRGYGAADGSSLLVAVVLPAGLVVYFSMSEILFGTTPGKVLTGSRVYTEQGKKASTQQIIARSFIRLVPFEPLSFMFYRNWHDEWSGTRVLKIRNKALEEEIWDIPVEVTEI